MLSRRLLAVSAMAASAGPAMAQPYGPGMYGWGGGHWPLGMVIWPLILIGLVVLLVWAVRSVSTPRVPPPAARRSPGLDVLEERYARGEIGRDEYLQKKADLGG
jgi:putative membrane protein